MNSISTNYKASASFSTNISVRFVNSSPLNLIIKPMKIESTVDESAQPIIPSLENVISLFVTDVDPLFKRNDSPRTLSYLPFRLKNIEFRLEAPMANSVKLAADFTDWDKFPLDMNQSVDGVWHLAVPLLPGKYAYRFIVDDQWCDDPRSVHRIQNPFGSSNAIIQVANENFRPAQQLIEKD